MDPMSASVTLQGMLLCSRYVNKAGSLKAKSLKAKARSLKAKTKAKARDQG